MSPMGDAVTRLPARLARLRTCREANASSIFFSSGSSAPIASSSSVSVAAPPTTKASSVRVTRRSSVTPSVETNIA